MELQLVNERRRSAYAARRLAEFAERCRAGGLAVTPQRLAIIKGAARFGGASARSAFSPMLGAALAEDLRQS